MDSLILESSSSRAEILLKGAYLKSLRLHGTTLLKPTSDEFETHGGCAVLLPYAGRIKNARYSYNGTSYSLPKNREGNAIHGFLKSESLEIKKITSNSVELVTTLSHPGYPTRLDVSVKYEVSDKEFSASCCVGNIGTSQAPLSVGFHPYILAKRWEIKHECEIEKLEMDDGLFPNGKTSIFNFNGRKYGGGVKLDNCFYFPCDPIIETDFGKLKLRKKNMPYVVVYNGKWAEEKSVAIEPYTSAPDAFNNGFGLIQLPKDHSHESGFNLELL